MSTEVAIGLLGLVVVLVVFEAGVLVERYKVTKERKGRLRAIALQMAWELNRIDMEVRLGAERADSVAEEPRKAGYTAEFLRVKSQQRSFEPADLVRELVMNSVAELPATTTQLWIMMENILSQTRWLIEEAVKLGNASAPLFKTIKKHFVRCRADVITVHEALAEWIADERLEFELPPIEIPGKVT